MLIKNQTRTKITKKKTFESLQRCLEIIDKILKRSHPKEKQKKKNTLQILLSKFCGVRSGDAAQKWYTQPCLVCCMQSMDPTAGFVIVFFFSSLFLIFSRFFAVLIFFLGLPFLVCMRQGWFVLKAHKVNGNLYIYFFLLTHLAPPSQMIYVYTTIYVNLVITICKYKQIGKVVFCVSVWPYLITAGIVEGGGRVRWEVSGDYNIHFRIVQL